LGKWNGVRGMERGEEEKWKGERKRNENRGGRGMKKG
jgi:hypothetical protein